MDFLDLVRRRFSVRSYEKRAIPDEKLEMVIEAGHLAPSAANRQAWRFVVVKDERQRHALGEAYPREWFWTAPVIVVVCVDPAKAWVRADGKNYADVDGAIAMDHMTLCAADLGLGTCWIGAFEPAKVRRVLGIPESIEPLAMTPLGFPAEPIRSKSRKPLHEIMHYERYEA
jgi:nitroreductase